MLYGDAGANTLAGGAAATTSTGLGRRRRAARRRGADLLVGGLGADVFDFDIGRPSRRPGARDIIRADIDVGLAFEGVGVAGGDRIDLSGIDANTGAAGNQAFVFGGTGIGRVSLVDSGGNTIVRCNTDGDAAFELELVIEDGSAPSPPRRRLHPRPIDPSCRLTPTRARPKEQTTWPTSTSRPRRSDVRLNDPNLVGFGALDGTPTATSWSYLTPAGHRVSVTGTGMTYDAAGRPIAGTATSISIDLGADGVRGRARSAGSASRRRPSTTARRASGASSKATT